MTQAPPPPTSRITGSLSSPASCYSAVPHCPSLGPPSHLLCAEVHALVHGHVWHGSRHGQGQGEVVGPAEAASEDCASICRARGKRVVRSRLGEPPSNRNTFKWGPREGKSFAQDHTAKQTETNKLDSSMLSSTLAPVSTPGHGDDLAGATSSLALCRDAYGSLPHFQPRQLPVQGAERCQGGFTGGRATKGPGLSCLSSQQQGSPLLPSPEGLGGKTLPGLNTCRLQGTAMWEGLSLK